LDAENIEDTSSFGDRGSEKLVEKHQDCPEYCFQGGRDHGSIDENDVAEAMAKFSAFLGKEIEFSLFATSPTRKGLGTEA